MKFLSKLFLSAKECKVSKYDVPDIVARNLGESREVNNLAVDFANKVHAIGGTSLSAPPSNLIPTDNLSDAK